MLGREVGTIWTCGIALVIELEHAIVGPKYRG